MAGVNASTTATLPAGVSIDHLLRHHGDFEQFYQVMIDTSAGRFGPIWWGVWDQHVRPTAHADVIDLGTGPGLLLPMLRERIPHGRLVGVEVQPVMVEAAREQARLAHGELIVSDLAQPVPLPDQSADVVTSVMVFHELVHPPPHIKEAWRLVKPGGVFVLYDWVKRPLESYLDDGQELTPDTLQHFREHCLFSTDDLVFLVKRAGFEIREVIGRRGGNYAIIVAERPE